MVVLYEGEKYKKKFHESTDHIRKALSDIMFFFFNNCGFIMHLKIVFLSHRLQDGDHTSNLFSSNFMPAFINGGMTFFIYKSI